MSRFDCAFRWRMVSSRSVFEGLKSALEVRVRVIHRGWVSSLYRHEGRTGAILAIITGCRGIDAKERMSLGDDGGVYERKDEDPRRQ